MANQIDLKGRNAVVTGGAQGIGYAVAERLLSSGARVALWDRDQALAEKAAASVSSMSLHQELQCKGCQRTY